MRSGRWILCVAGALIAAACGGEAAPTERTDEADEDVIGGVAADSASFNAVGAIVRELGGGQPRQKFCSGALIAPRVVLTAKHCVLSNAVDPTSPRFMD